MCIVSFIFPLFQHKRQAYYAVYYMFQYFAQAMTAFITCVMAKKHFKRPRPSVKNVPKRYFNIRGKEIDCSWPSGDTAQSGIFALFLWQNMYDLVIRIPGGMGWYLLFFWVLHVAFGRIFFHCHYIGDTIGGYLVAWFVAHVNTFVTNVLVLWRQIQCIELINKILPRWDK